jgi:hypothetical protein
MAGYVRSRQMNDGSEALQGLQISERPRCGWVPTNFADGGGIAANELQNPSASTGECFVQGSSEHAGRPGKQDEGCGGDSVDCIDGLFLLLNLDAGQTNCGLVA